MNSAVPPSSSLFPPSLLADTCVGFVVNGSTYHSYASPFPPRPPWSKPKFPPDFPGTSLCPSRGLYVRYYRRGVDFSSWQSRRGMTRRRSNATPHKESRRLTQPGRESGAPLSQGRLRGEFTDCHLLVRTSHQLSARGRPATTPLHGLY